MSRPGTFRSKSSDKALPSLPAGGLGLNFSGLPISPASGLSGLGLGLELNPKSSKPPPSHFIPLQRLPTTVYTSNIPPISSPSVVSSSPSTPIASSSISISGYPFPYGNEHYSNSTSTVINRNTSTTTLTQLERPPDSPSISKSTAPPDISSSFTPKKKKVGFGQAESIRSENVMLSSSTFSTSTTSSGQKQDVPLGRKRSSGQLLMGIGKGLNRVGSVMRRNTESNVDNTSPNKKGYNVGGGSTWRKGRRRKTNDWEDGWEKVDKIGEEGDEGDAGIGRPCNIAHDLHVSPDLSDLPEQWLSSLKAQGLTESDLILISAARKKQHETHRLPLRTTSRLPQAPLSAPPSRLLDAPRREMIAGPSSEDSHQIGSSGLLKKFSFEDRSPTTPTQAGTSSTHIAESSPMTSSSIEMPNHNQLPSKFLQSTPSKHDRRRAVESFPVSAAGSSDLDHNHNLEVENVFNPHRNSTISALPGERTDVTVPTRRNKRFSSQLKGFRESTFGLGEEDEGEWGKSVLNSTCLSPSAKEKGKMRDDKIPVPPEPLFPLSSSQSQIISKKSGHGTPSHDAIEEEVMPKSPPPPARPRKQPSVTLLPIPNQDTDQIPKEDEVSEVEIETRKSSESFGVPYNTSIAKSKSSISIGSELITPSISMEQGMTVREKGDSDEGHEHERQGEYTFGSINEIKDKDADNYDQPTGLISQEGLIRRYHSNPHISLPASAIHSRSTTPDSISSSSNTKLKPNLVHQQSYSTFDPTPYKVLEEDELMDGLDRANPEERASIALSILSSRTSVSMQSLHELSQATVRTAYKLPPVGGISPITSLLTSNPFTNDITTNKYADDNGNENEKDTNIDDNENNDKDNNTSTNSSSSGGLKLIEESSECGSISLVSTSGWGSEANDGEGEAKDAMDALGEAARRLRSS
ncbi:hypothetical protein V866_007079 [Kwoniella sp. B9012]